MKWKVQQLILVREAQCGLGVRIILSTPSYGLKQSTYFNLLSLNLVKSPYR